MKAIEQPRFQNSWDASLNLKKTNKQQPVFKEGPDRCGIFGVNAGTDIRAQEKSNIQ